MTLASETKPQVLGDGAALPPLVPEPWSDGIAIIGMSARFPQSRNVQEYWQHLINGDVLIGDLAEQDLRGNGVTTSTLADPSYVRRGSSIEQADCFDYTFFGLSRREAEILDPQHRVFLECAWEALENAGRTGENERVGVFAGTGINTYMLQLLGNPEVQRSAGDYQLMLANDKDFLATRTAYKLNLRGPSVTVQTACSTSLAAVHLACRSLLNRECSMALAGGVSISFPQGMGYSYTPGMILSPDGYCRPFDAKSQGTVPGRGAGIVVLKRLSDALADRDSIVAVIRGSAWNNDGAGKVGYTAPSIEGQTEVIRAALSSAGVDASRIGYVETHGTATELGDAVEFAALVDVFAAKKRYRPLVLGAIKANMGHADVAAGVAGLIKTALAVKSGIIPPTPTFKRPNPTLGIEKTSFNISSSTVDWSGESERWAGVSSFGIGGTNVHVVLNSPPQLERHERETTDLRIYPVSTKTATALNIACEHLSEVLSKDTALSAADVSTTLQHGRREFDFRRAVVANSCVEAASLLQRKAATNAPGTNLASDILFLFPGQGQQFPAMASELYRRDLEFRGHIDNGCVLLREEAGLDLLPFLSEAPGASFSNRLRDTEIGQPALFLVEYALASRLRSLGVEPSGLLGHSLGELTAAAIAGVFSFEDGLRLAAERGRLMAQTPAGLMLAVMLSSEDLSPFLTDGLWLAAENGPRISVASGLVDAIEDLERRLEAKKVASIRLASRNAFHTPLMADAAKAFRTAVEAVPRHPPKIPWLSNVNGTWISPAEAQDPHYWADQILSPVRFTKCLSELAERPRLLMEVGPGEALLGLARQTLSSSRRVPCLGAENRQVSDAHVFLQAVATAWESGASIHWDLLETEIQRRRVALPTYPFERQRCWIDRASDRTETTSETPPPFSLPPSRIQPADSDKIADWFFAPNWQSTPPAGLVQPPQPKNKECWMVLAGEDQFSAALISALRTRGDTVLALRAGAKFEWRQESAILDPSNVVDMDMLWQRINASGMQPGGLLCLPGFYRNGLAYEAIVHILQTAWNSRRQLKRFEFITASLESVCGEPVEDPHAGDLSALARAIAIEFHDSECRTIDLELSAEGSTDSVIQIMDELSTCGADISVALRRGTRFQHVWSRAPLKKCTDTPFRNRGVYIITGGAGGIGYVLAKHLLSQHSARIVIVGRTTLPNRSEWQSWIEAHPEEDQISRRIRRIKDLESSGGEILYLAADVSDIEAMRAVIEETEKRFGPLNGVIHSAGIAIGGSRILFQSAEDARRIRSPKIEGSRVIADLLRGRDVDFLLFCSSISSHYPSPAESAYASANAFQNSFAGYCRSTLRIPAVAIAFDAWREIGMVADAVMPEGLQSYVDHLKQRAMDTREGIEVIHRVLGHWRGSHILTSTTQIPLAPVASWRQSISDQDAGKQSSQLQSKEVSAVIEIWKDLLGVDTISPTDNFFSLGGHSLMGTMMIARIRERLGISLSMRDVFEAQTPARLAELIQFASENASLDGPMRPLPTVEREILEI